MAEQPGTSRPIPISLTLAASIGLLVAIAVGVVFWTQWSTAQKNTNELVSQRANLYADQILKELDAQLQPARHQADFIADRIQRGLLDPADTKLFETALISSLAAAPQIISIAFLNTKLLSVSARRTAWNEVRMFRVDRSATPHIVAAYRQTEAAKTGFWGEIIFVDGLTLVNRRVPVRRNGKFIGVVAALISITEVSNLIDKFTKSLGGKGFVLYGRDRVLAHPILRSAHASQSVKTPLVDLRAIDDAVLNALAVRLDDPNDKGMSFAGRFERRDITIGKDQFATFVHWTNAFGGTPWGIGAWLNSRDVDVAQRRVLQAGYIGLALLLLSLVAAVIVAKSVSRPVQKLTEAANKIGSLELSEIGELPHNWIKELDDQASAFNTMLTGLRSFETYVPKSLVNRLIKRAGGAEVVSEEKNLTVLFTDIVGFTTMSEGQSAKDVAAMINEHLAILGKCVEDEGGTIDKYIGDALMAFWGAPDEQADTAERACRAALAMKSGLAIDNHARAAAGKNRIRIRVGIHQGPVLVGNIGAPGRINYTIIGDTVNTAARIEALGKEFDEGDDVTILISGEIARQMGPAFNAEAAGDFSVKGREEKVEVHRLRA